MRELAHRLAASEEALTCVSTQWFRFATGRPETATDECQLVAATEALTESDGDVRALVRHLATSPEFRSRRVP